ncbi:MAG: PDDEXK nuclease domain-containing protein [Bacteroidales bacterium]|nr:PDDEXK nuclease domain-containing protein [Bacteroidales bacterium]
MSNISNNNDFFENVASLIEQARQNIARTVDITMSITYYLVGQMIVEEEQSGETRATYGKALLKGLSVFLTNRLGRGYSETNLRNFRKFYLAYRCAIQQNVFAESEPSEDSLIQQNSSAELTKNDGHRVWQNISAKLKLGWSHYQILMRIKNESERRFYEIEAFQQQWTFEQLQRQYNSSLYERIALSKDKDEVLRLSCEGQTIEKPRDLLRNPITLEFLGLDERAAYTETKLETAIINKLQQFLLEMGKGFLFEARQKRFTFDEEHFFADLVFYNRLLQCYVLIDLKTDKLKHQDLGQMQMYVNYYDRFVKQNFEKPTIGILLCKEKKDTMVQLTLPENANIFASEYTLYLPDKVLLQQKLQQWTDEFEEDEE